MFDAASGTLTATGPVNPNNLIGSTSQAYSPLTEINLASFTPPTVNLAYGESLETRFSVSVSDARGDSSTTSLTNFLQSTAAAPVVIPPSNGGGSSSGGTGGTGTTIPPTSSGTGSGGTGSNTGSTGTGTNTDTTGTGTKSGTNTGTDTNTGSNSGGTVAPINPTTTVSNVGPVFRFFDKDDGTHFFTSDQNERNTILNTRADLVQETNGFGDVTASSPNAVAVYRFFDSIHGTHFFTSDANEKANVQATRSDLIFESSATFYEKSVGTSSDVAVYRMFDTHLGTHFYTGDAKEYAGITTPGSANYRGDLVAEGISFYAPSGSYV